MMSTFEFLTVYRIHETLDDRGAYKPCEFYSSEEKAKLAAVGRGWYGSDARVVPKTAVKLDNNYYVLASAKPIQLDIDCEKQRKTIVEKALLKLTPEERNALNLLGKI